MGIDQMECIRRGLDYNTELRRVHGTEEKKQARRKQQITELRPCPRQPTAPGYLDPYNLTDEQRQNIAQAMHQLRSGYYEVLAEGGSLYYVTAGKPIR